MTLGVIAQTAPDFSITDSQGNAHTLYAGYLDQGKTVLIKIFFTTCPPCNAIAPLMETLYQDWGGGDYDVEFFDLSNKNFDTDALVNSYRANHGHTYPGAGVEGGSLAAVAPYESGMFGPFFGTPVFVVIAPDGSMQYDVRGNNNTATIAALDAAIAATGAEKPTCVATINDSGFYCPGDSVLVYGTWYNTAGVYEELRPGQSGECDTMLTVTITAGSLNTATINASICPGEVYLYHGVTYSAGGTYLDTINSLTLGCDTIVTIHITALPINEKTVSASFTTGDSVLVYGTWYSMEGVYFDLVGSLDACDTIVTIHITEIPVGPEDVVTEGFVRTFGGLGIKDAVVTVFAADTMMVAQKTTDALGQYSFTFDATYFESTPLSVRVRKTINPLNGVSVLDIVALQKHLLGLELLNNTQRLFAADVNRSGSISVLDIVHLRRMLLGFINVFPGDDTWVFFHAGLDLGAPGEQPPVLPINDPVSLQGIHSGSISGVFRGIKLGDLNNSADPQQ